ncbi:MAG: hypothetical protein ACTS2F_00130 [Thainema sp.]
MALEPKIAEQLLHRGGISKIPESRKQQILQRLSQLLRRQPSN